MARSIAVIPARVVAGPLMHAYASFEHADEAAWSAAGQPYPSQSVTEMAGGFKLCWPASSTGPRGCDNFTAITVNHAGQITGLSVDGEPVAGRIATAPEATSDGLMISDIVAYRLTGTQQVAVAFKLTDSTYRPRYQSPSLIASFNGASEDMHLDALPQYLAPGNVLYAAAGFDVANPAGQFCLHPNDGFGETLPCSTLSKV